MTPPTRPTFTVQLLIFIAERGLSCKLLQTVMSRTVRTLHDVRRNAHRAGCSRRSRRCATRSVPWRRRGSSWRAWTPQPDNTHGNRFKKWHCNATRLLVNGSSEHAAGRAERSAVSSLDMPLV